ncbi:unnamed protein product, partial [Phaeothamnion confervicola]
MKFGKNISRVVELSDPEWAPFWLNYKFLKKKVKGLEEHDGAAATLSSPAAIAKSAGEVAFFKLTRQELRKCSEFFTSAETQFLVRQKRVAEGWRQLKTPDHLADGDPHKRLMAACVKLYKDLLLLENYAIMTYCGFSKILKKHDKATGYRTRERFMKNVVNLAPFTRYPKVMEMLNEVENLFKEIQVFSSSTHVTHNSEEQLFIDAMRTINTEASKLQQQETADIGMNVADFDGPVAGAPGGRRLRTFSEACDLSHAAGDAGDAAAGGSAAAAADAVAAAAAAAAGEALKRSLTEGDMGPIGGCHGAVMGGGYGGYDGGHVERTGKRQK